MSETNEIIIIKKKKNRTRKKKMITIRVKIGTTAMRIEIIRIDRMFIFLAIA